MELTGAVIACGGGYIKTVPGQALNPPGVGTNSNRPKTTARSTPIVLAPYVANTPTGPCMALGPANPVPNATVLAPGKRTQLAQLRRPTRPGRTGRRRRSTRRPWRPSSGPPSHSPAPTQAFPGLGPMRQAGLSRHRRNRRPETLATSHPTGPTDDHRHAALTRSTGAIRPRRDGRARTHSKARPGPTARSATSTTTSHRHHHPAGNWTATWRLGPMTGRLNALHTTTTLAGYPVQQIQAIITG